MPGTPLVPLPEGLWLSYVGDDFTGSTDVMEAFTVAGVPTVLFLQAPTPAAMQRFAGMRCVGVATLARAQSPAWMSRELPPIFQSLKALGAPVLQYKVCSTFDSSPTVGSIGHAVDLGVQAMPGSTWSPMVVGAPRLNRFQLFGHLFASVDGVGHRLDRHPTMSRHPVTPMDEADLAKHLGKQTSRRVDVITMPQLKQGSGGTRRDAIQGPDVPITLIDVLDQETLVEAGRVVWEGRGSGVFSASSSGLEYALAAYWQQVGLLPPPKSPPQVQPVPLIVAVSGSCSPVTASQIAQARERGFAVLRVDVPALLGDGDGEVARLTDAALAALRGQQSPLIASAEGPDDEAVRHFDAMAAAAGLSRSVASERVSGALAAVLKHVLQASGVQRAVVAGGDTSGAVATALGIDALTLAAALAPGAPLCHAWRQGEAAPVLEIALKGGQLGGAHFFARARGDDV